MNTAIAEKFAALGGSRGFLGKLTTDEGVCPDGKGRYSVFRNGSIYWTPETGAHAVHGAIKAKWEALGWERGVLGYPTTDEEVCPDGKGRYNCFQNGTIHWTPETGAHEVHGAIKAKWEALGWERGVLGYPTTDEEPCPDGKGRYSVFQEGSIYWTPETGAHEVHGAIYKKWVERGREQGPGYPTTDEEPSPDGKGRFNHFEESSIYWSPETGAHLVQGLIRRIWAKAKWERGRYRYPITDELPTNKGAVSYFQGGTIRYVRDDDCVTTNTKPKEAQYSVWLQRSVPFEGPIAYEALWPPLGTTPGSYLVSIENPDSPLDAITLQFVKLSRTTRDCGNPSAVIVALPGQTLKDDALREMFGSKKPSLPVRFVACAGGNRRDNVPAQVLIIVKAYA